MREKKGKQLSAEPSKQGQCRKFDFCRIYWFLCDNHAVAVLHRILLLICFFQEYNFESVQGPKQEPKPRQEGPIQEQERWKKGESFFRLGGQCTDTISFPSGSGPKQEQQQGRSAPPPQLGQIRVS